MGCTSTLRTPRSSAVISPLSLSWEKRTSTKLSTLPLALTLIQSAGARKTDRVGKLAGRLTAALSYTPLEEIMSDLHEFTTSIRRLCGQIHGGIYQVYISYPLDAALEG